MTLENDASLIESGKKSKKRKHDKQDSEHFIDDVNISKDDEKIKKKQKKTEIHQGVGVSDVCNEVLDTTMNHPYSKEEKKNKKNRNLKSLEDEGLPSSDHVDMTLEGSDKSHKARKGKKDECNLEMDDGNRNNGKEKSDKKKKKQNKEDECNLEMDDGNRKTEKAKNDKKKKKQDKEMDNGVHKGEKEANDQDGDLSKEFEKKKRKREKKATKDGLDCGLSVTENNNDVTDQVENQVKKKTAVKKNKNATEQVEKNKDGLDCGFSVTENNNVVTDQVTKHSKKKTAVEKNKNATEQVKKKKVGSDSGLSVTQKDNDVTDQVGNQSKKKTAVEENRNATEQVKKKKTRSKKVTFSSDVEVFPLDKEAPEENKEKKLIRGKRFTLEEDEKIKEAVNNYIIEHNLGEKGVDMIMHCKSHPEIKNCWKEIALALPHRPVDPVYYRAHILFERDESHKWSKEDLDVVRKFHAEHGPKWKELAELTGRHRVHIKDTWRRIRYLNKKSGQWSQEEYQNLFDLVHTDLKLKVFADKNSKHGMLRDNIGWTAISDTLTTRTDATCCEKWYRQLSSPMVGEGLWADTDDYRLLGMLYNLDACNVEEVDWDNLLEHRSGDVCRKRWNQMVQHIGSNKLKSFPEQVEVMLQRYKLEALEAREIWDNKPYTD